MYSPLTNITYESDQFRNRQPPQPSQSSSYPPNAPCSPYYVNSPYSPGTPVSFGGMSSPFASSGSTRPVYGPSMATPFQQFYDVATGAPLSVAAQEDLSMQQHQQQQASYASQFQMMSPYAPVATDETPQIPCPCVYCTGAAVPVPVVADMSPPPVIAEVVPTPTRAERPRRESQLSTNHETPVRRQNTRNMREPRSGPREPRSAGKFSTPSTKAPSGVCHSNVFTVEVSGHHGRAQRVVSHIPLEVGAHVVFEGDRGEDMGVVQHISQERDGSPSRPGVSMVVRNATMDEIKLWTGSLVEDAIGAVADCNEAIMRLGLSLVVHSASFQLDRAKLTFFYECEQRVDFRRLLIEMFNKHRCRIWMERL